MNKTSSPKKEAPSIVKVGAFKKYLITKNPKTGRPKKTPILFAYKDVEYDLDGWADCSKFLPEDFDLVHLRLKREKTVSGWIVGFKWVGLRLKNDDIVCFWKKTDEGRE